MTIRQINIQTNVETTIPDNRVVSEEEVANGIRDERNEELRSTVDVIAGNVLRWNCLTTEEQALWTTYRLELLDVPQQAGFPNTITWPTKPS
jgi:hypothetical protein